MKKEPYGFIRKAKYRDLQSIKGYLTGQGRNFREESYPMAIDLIEESFYKGELQVFVSPGRNDTLAYLTGKPHAPELLEVKVNHRGQGIGTVMVKYCIEAAKSEGLSHIYITCPEGTMSAPFWKKMGFTIHEGKNHNTGLLILDKVNPLPLDGKPVSLCLKFYPGSKKWKPDTKPLAGFNPKAVQTDDGIIHLGRRVSIVDFPGLWERDLVMFACMNGEVIYCDKAKYKQAERLGLQSEPFYYFIDRIFPDGDCPEYKD